ncbi:fructosamine kinase family protein [Butyrivibrio sp. WCD3002]|uniref:fructosamine kinase family protein n=1 Tax=Butyrivibrio sp. WCD3002 TaxID=1280676 RepID=UPI0018CBDA55|nr:fructosamine kinase family protein [Butyrivibrio sp. WCD3002]
MKTISYPFPVCKSLNEAVMLMCGENTTIESRQTIMGGDANDAYLLHLSNGEKAFIKVNVRGNADFFWEEARGLLAIDSTKTMRVPKIYAAGTDGNISFLLMEYINSGCLSSNFWESLGIGLAKLHQADTSGFVVREKYGFTTDNYIGAGKQINTPKNSWIEFFAECRLKPQFKLAERYFDSYLIKAAMKRISL